MKKETNVKITCCSTRQKILGIVALAGLFACGLFVGLAVNGGSHKSTEDCEAIESFLLARINPINSDQAAKHNENIDTYKILLAYGCPENREAYQGFIQRESAILDILKNNRMQENTQACAEIEQLLLESLPTEYLNHSSMRIKRAQIYANLSERGCAEHSKAYVDLAAKELEIARALSDDKFDKGETVEVVETYKRLEMKQAANEVLNKVQKLTDPAIDFILQVQKIIEE